MGILNLTPDSFYDGGRHQHRVEERVAELLARGADLLDLGAESTKPGSPEVPAEEQWKRLEPALEVALESRAFVSIDTMSPAVAERCLVRGAHLINDVSCLRDPELARVAAAHDAWLVLSHSRGSMSEMGGFSHWPDDGYDDIVEDVKSDWGEARERAMQAGMRPERLIFDPGIGFSKNARHCFELLARLDEFRSLQAPMLVGPSRKSFIAALDESFPGDRLGGSIAACLACAQAGANVLRVHDVFEVRQALRVWHHLQGLTQAEA